MKLVALGFIGVGILGAAVWGSLSALTNNTLVTPPSPASVASPSPVPTTQATGSTLGSSFKETAKKTCGDPPDASATWYGVFIDGGNLNEVRTKHCKDAIAVNRQDSGKASIQVASFSDRSKAEIFARSVNGEAARYEPNLPKKTAQAETSTSYSDDSLNAAFLEVQGKVSGFPDTPESRNMVYTLATTYCNVKRKGASDEVALALYLNGVNKSGASQEVKLLSSAVGGSIMYAAKTHVCP